MKTTLSISPLKLTYLVTKTPTVSPLHHYKIKSVTFTPKIQVKYKFGHDDNWNETTVTSRAGRSTKKYPNYWNKSSDGSEKFMNFGKINQPQILDQRSGSGTLKNRTNLNNTPTNPNYVLVVSRWSKTFKLIVLSCSSIQSCDTKNNMTKKFYRC